MKWSGNAVTVMLYLYDQPVLETYWSYYPAAESFARKAIIRKKCRAVLIWKGEGKPWPDDDGGDWRDPELMFFVVKN